jgi:hypothetical protein
VFPTLLENLCPAILNEVEFTLRHNNNSDLWYAARILTAAFYFPLPVARLHRCRSPLHCKQIRDFIVKGCISQLTDSGVKGQRYKLNSDLDYS